MAAPRRATRLTAVQAWQIINEWLDDDEADGVSDLEDSGDEFGPDSGGSSGEGSDDRGGGGGDVPRQPVQNVQPV